jgi:hypothetical protein
MFFDGRLFVAIRQPRINLRCERLGLYVIQAIANRRMIGLLGRGLVVWCRTFFHRLFSSSSCLVVADDRCISIVGRCAARAQAARIRAAPPGDANYNARTAFATSG